MDPVECRERRGECGCGLHWDAAYAEGVRRFQAGYRLGISCDIFDDNTYGYGRLNNNGDWEFPVPACLVLARLRKTGSYAAPKEGCDE